MKQLIGIIADDLTGANDSGVQLTENGINTSVLFDIPKEANNTQDSGIVIDTNSRALSKEAAKSITRDAAIFLKAAGYRYIYKKMDSTLRGHIGTELQAVCDVFQPDFVIIAPAFPAYGRTTKDGVHYVNGVKLGETEISKDPKHPVTDSYIPSHIEKEIGEQVGLIMNVDRKQSRFQEKLNQYKQNNIRFIVCDAESQKDLQALAQEVSSLKANIVWAGSAGLAKVLPDVLGISKKIVERQFAHAQQVMTVCGSLSQVTQCQVEFASRQQDVTAVELDTLQMFTNNWDRLSKQYVAECIDGLRSGNDLVVYVPSNEQVRQQVKQLGTELQLSSNQIGERISEAIGEIVAQVAQSSEDISGFVLTGGDTAKEVARHLRGIGFRLIRQIEAGIPLGTLIGTDDDYKVVTKAGAFGKQESIYQAMQVLKGVRD